MLQAIVHLNREVTSKRLVECEKIISPYTEFILLFLISTHIINTRESDPLADIRAYTIR